jgi:fructose/tagatose bisphosphate aldolase
MSSITDQLAPLAGAVSLTPEGRVGVRDVARLRERVDALARASALGQPEERAAARWLLWQIAQDLGIRPASIHDLYCARGRGQTPLDFTVPAMNLRALAFDAARAVFRAAMPAEVGAMVFEIARSEIGYTDQRPAEYTASVLAAAIKEGYAGPVFLQGDHFQVSAKKYAEDPDGELGAVLDLSREAIQAGFFNIDVDTSTLVDLELPTLADQQRLNADLCARATAHVRALEPEGMTVSVGGEIGEVGGRNSTEDDLRAFMQEYERALDPGLVGLSKISVQTGTSHGGVVLPDGTLAQVKVDFDTLARLSRLARQAYGMAGAVQHGASTLPEAAFGKFPEAEACEVHLATNFQNMLFDRLPDDLRQEIYAWLVDTKSDMRKPSETEEQFLYKNRKRAIGPFKGRLWDLPEDFRQSVREAWERQFAFLFERLCVVRTRELVDRHVDAVPVRKSLEDFGVADAGAEDVTEMAD